MSKAAILVFTVPIFSADIPFALLNNVLLLALSSSRIAMAARLFIASPDSTRAADASMFSLAAGILFCR